MMWTPLHAKIHRIISSRGLFAKKSRLLIAVSGGQDSLALAKLLLDLQPKWGWDLAVVHFDHCWRDDSQENAQHVQKLMESWQIPFYLETAIETISSEAAAREWRYEILSAIAFSHKYTHIVTGHTQSDRAETLLYNLIRGSGTDGLQSLTWQRQLNHEISLVRPLLTVTRTQTYNFCQELNLPIWEDSTNQDLKYARNRIRNEVLPYLRQHFNQNVESAIAQTAELLQAEVEYLEQAAQELREKATEQGTGEQGEMYLAKINRQILKTAPLALQRRVMRQILQETLSISPNFQQIEKLTALITAPNRTQTDPFSGNALAFVQRDWIYLQNLPLGGKKSNPDNC
ncbi:tRNA lysidine(34) synthetase TilS [Calothrix sp. PCC 6303]|uniref:tRNA lysidine(34) synthetase TilS n=1 Tax=Calothrix sp. PCC 6303 TaxID=1170562 RepID=UPI0005A20AD2|nr:tRNA lysidine(34) synthetase TilS [Calothrix sp. PCC 6303]